MQLRYDSYQLILSIVADGDTGMNIRDLEYLVALSEHNHFRRAAKCLSCQPADTERTDPQAPLRMNWV